MRELEPYPAKLNEMEYRRFVEDRLHVLGIAVEGLSKLVEQELDCLPDPKLTDGFKARCARKGKLRQIQEWMQTRFTGD